MNSRELAERLEEICEEVVGRITEGRCFYCVDYDCDDCEYMEALRGIDKQIPKKPIGVELRCGRCGAYLEGTYQYCPKCGQAIDWGISDAD